MASITTTTIQTAEAAKKALNVKWGRRSKAQWTDFIGAGLITIWCPVWMTVNWVALEYKDGSITEATKLLWQNGVLQFLWRYCPLPDRTAVICYASWTLLQAAFYVVLPGRKVNGQLTPHGHILQYTTNGLLAWTITHILAVAGSFMGYLDPAFVAVNWAGFLAVANAWGFVLGFILWVKGNLAPSLKGDQKLTGSWLYDFTFGIELNPRIKDWDLKFFYNSRPGIVAWTIIDLSWAAYQYQVHGRITWSMMAVTMLHAIYVVDFFVNEDWYTKTIDITHDHLGFLLAWGDVTFLPSFYTLQTQYLARYPGKDSPIYAGVILFIGAACYLVFRSANDQRGYARRFDGKVTIWNSPARILRCTYQTADGSTHKTILLTSGWWGLVRHPNYLADLLLSAAMCATAGFRNILPWSYFIFMTILLVHRSERDHRRCQIKYGEQWNKYCELVPYRIIPWIF